ncbi:MULTISPECIES: ABC transporter ATP-binding protein [unclassified Solwaraspora]|uniref:ABC transporter ATP-binding protein n=1 Tax=unclassified Solwaraspora TaxID=2627926 RepID=UPI00248C23DE|nr:MULTISPECIES: ABC transporter ATP-binding protein [unclassified Solwaraspora]WBB99877.1 ABC transporter ATP-binding protein [Solwaraspora sp. WMMA2059]WBC21575.1 ABC transporter ATP-binding protein [Solwaraspora sp. WMMA2080]WJK36388.1 ABC transporter ATP-binding protein [Solwaraspora sp. WMMA2065]
MTALLSVCGLSVVARLADGDLRLLDDVDLDVERGRIVGVVGESGSGKTTLARTVVGLLERNVDVEQGRVTLAGDEVVAPGVDRTDRVRGSAVGMVFQDASRSLNPLMKIGTQLVEVLRRHVRGITRAEVERRSVEVLAQMRITDPARVLGSYPHQLSGGLRQRVAIGLAVVTRPALVIADECTTALDVTTQTKVVELFRTLVDELGIGLLFVTHDLMLASDLCDRIAVMSSGRVVEQGAAKQVLDEPQQEYTRRLLAAIPSWS